MMVDCKIKIETNVDEVLAVINRMAAHLESAPDDDAAKQAMVAFGEIDIDRHCPMDSRYEKGCIRITFSLDPELRRIADMLPG